MTENIVKSCLKNHFQTNEESDMNTVEVYYQLGNISTFKQDTSSLKDNVQRHLKATPPHQHVSIRMYYKANKMESQLSVCDQFNLVYSFKCIDDSCNAPYVVYSTNKISTRTKQHRILKSNGCKHYVTDHDKKPPKVNVLKDCFSIVYKSRDTTSVKIAEVVTIKKLHPYINVKFKI